MPEGDSLHRIAERLQPLVGETLAVEASHPRARVLGVAERLDGKRLERVEAVGKNLLLSFEGGLVLRSQLRMRGRWHLRPVSYRYVGRPWLVLRGREWQALQWNGPVLELGRGIPASVRRLGPDIMDIPPDLHEMVARIRAGSPEREVGEVLLDQRVVAGIGNMWKAEALWLAGLSPWAPVGEIPDAELCSTLGAAHAAMTSSRRRRVYRRSGTACPRCGALIRSWPQGDGARTAYWCPGCQGGTGSVSA